MESYRFDLNEEFEASRVVFHSFCPRRGAMHGIEHGDEPLRQSLQSIVVDFGTDISGSLSALRRHSFRLIDMSKAGG